MSGAQSVHLTLKGLRRYHELRAQLADPVTAKSSEDEPHVASAEPPAPASSQLNSPVSVNIGGSVSNSVFQSLVLIQHKRWKLHRPRPSNFFARLPKF